MCTAERIPQETGGWSLGQRQRRDSFQPGRSEHRERRPRKTRHLVHSPFSALRSPLPATYACRAGSSNDHKVLDANGANTRKFRSGRQNAQKAQNPEAARQRPNISAWAKQAGTALINSALATPNSDSPTNTPPRYRDFSPRMGQDGHGCGLFTRSKPRERRRFFTAKHANYANKTLRSPLCILRSPLSKLACRSPLHAPLSVNGLGCVGRSEICGCVRRTLSGPVSGPEFRTPNSQLAWPLILCSK